MSSSNQNALNLPVSEGVFRLPRPMRLDHVLVLLPPILPEIGGIVDFGGTSISDAGAFSGTATASGTGITSRGSNAQRDFPALLPAGHSNYGSSGGINSGGNFKGSFYGRRSDSADREVAGS